MGSEGKYDNDACIIDVWAKRVSMTVIHVKLMFGLKGLVWQ